MPLTATAQADAPGGHGLERWLRPSQRTHLAEGLGELAPLPLQHLPLHQALLLRLPRGRQLHAVA